MTDLKTAECALIQAAFDITRFCAPSSERALRVAALNYALAELDSPNAHLVEHQRSAVRDALQRKRDALLGVQKK